MNSRWLSSSNHHLLSDARYRNGTRAVELADALRPGADPDRRRARRRTAARRSTIPTTATVTLARISTPSMPTEVEGGFLVVEELQPSSKTGWSQPCDHAVAERQPEGHAQEHGRDGQQDQRDGHDPGRLVDLVPDLLRAAERAPEGQAHQPEHVERGQPGDDEADRPDPLEPELERLAEDLVLREEAGQRRDAGDRQRADRASSRR